MKKVLKPFNEVKQEVRGEIGTWGPKKVECDQCGCLINHAAIVGEDKLCKGCYEFLKTAVEKGELFI